MPRLRRRRVVKIMVSDDELAELRHRARSHRKQVATWARGVLLGDQGAAVKDADAWWDALPPSRRAQVHRWVAGSHATAEPFPGQLDMLEEDAS